MCQPYVIKIDKFVTLLKDYYFHIIIKKGWDKIDTIPNVIMAKVYNYE